MANNDLLKEAIADAKAVKETAIANAKLALEEAFTPHLKSMLSAKLEEMEKEDDKMEEMAHAGKEKKVDEYGSMKKYEEDDMKMEEKEEMDEGAHEELDEINLDELLAELNEEEKVSDKARREAEEEGYEDGYKDAVEDAKDALDKIEDEAEDEKEEKEEVKEGMHDKDMEEGMHSDEMDEGMHSDDEVKEDARTDAEEEGYLDGMKDEKEDMEDKEVDLDDMSEDDLKGFIEDVIKDLVADGTIEAGEDFEDEEMEVDMVDDVDVDVEIDEAAHMDKGETGVGNEDGDKDDSRIEKETERMRFKEAMEEIQELKKELNEVNLLNAKLLYTNKIFKSKNLTEGKKVKVLKAFDKASTVKEAKVIFETLNEGLISKPASVARPKGSASKATGTITEAKKPIIESNDVYNRMRKLAGLI